MGKFVEIGGGGVIGDGKDAGKIAAIVNVIDQNRVLIDGPTSGVSRQQYPIRPIKVTFAFNASTKIVRKEMEAAKVNETWASSSWAKRMELKSKRNGLNDFDRFKLQRAKSARNKIVAKALNAKKKQLRKAKA